MEFRSNRIAIVITRTNMWHSQCLYTHTKNSLIKWSNRSYEDIIISLIMSVVILCLLVLHSVPD